MKWLGHKQHFIGADECQFSLATLLDNGYLVSTIGDYMPKNKGRVTLSSPDSYYETYVFRTTPGRFQECGCPIIDDLSFGEGGGRYRTAKEAADGHMQMINKFLKD